MLDTLAKHSAGAGAAAVGIATAPPAENLMTTVLHYALPLVYSLVSHFLIKKLSKTNGNRSKIN